MRLMHVQYKITIKPICKTVASWQRLHMRVNIIVELLKTCPTFPPCITNTCSPPETCGSKKAGWQF